MRRKWRFFTGVLLLSMTMAAASLPLSFVSAASATASDFQMKGDTLVKYTGTSSAVAIPASVRHIGQEAFAGHEELTKVSIPGYVEDIGYNAFKDCTALTQILLPDTVTEIESGAFDGCSSLQKITAGKNLDKLGNGVFTNCTALNEIVISKNNDSFSCDSGVLYSKDKTILYAMLPGYRMGSFLMPSSVKEIKDNAFWGCNNLTKVEIGANVKQIPSFAFYNCRSLETAVFSYSVTTIGLKAFADCTNLGDVEIPESVREIHSTAFDGCPKLNIIADEGSKAAEFDAQRDKSNAAQTEYEDILNTDSGQDSGQETDAVSNADTASNAADTETAGDSAEKVLGESEVVDGSAVVPIDNSLSDVLTGNTVPDTGEGGAVSKEVITGSQDLGFPKYTVVNNEKIAGQAYYGKSELTSCEIPSTIKEIGDFAFARSGLESVVIPNGVTRIGYGAFYHCDSLKDITIPDTVTEIEPAAFSNTQWMEDQLSDRIHKFTVVGDGILVAYSGAGGQVVVPEGVKQIGAEVFKDHDLITGVTFPESLLTIGEDAFSGCSSLTGVNGGNNLAEIRDRAFAGCPIGTIKLPASVKKIGLKAFDLSKTDKEDGTKIAVFLGKQLPEVSYEKTATRLANTDYRDSVLKDVRIAVVDASISSLADVNNTVLDYDKGGFRGFVCSVAQAAEGDTPGQLKIQFCVMHEEDVQTVTIPSTVIVYGKNYEIINPEDAVVYASEKSDQKAEDSEEAGTIRVELESTTLPDTPTPTAEITGITEDYVLSVKDNENAAGTVMTAFKNAASGGRMTSLQAYELTLRDENRGIPVTKLGKLKMPVTIAKPAGISLENLHVVCTDEDGQLETVEHRIVTVDGQSCIQFTARHFSFYGFYN